VHEGGAADDGCIAVERDLWFEELTPADAPSRIKLVAQTRRQQAASGRRRRAVDTHFLHVSDHGANAAKARDEA
jgi:hypothetical protein